MLAPRKKLWSTPMEVIDRAIDELHIDATADTVFDIGAGDGRFMIRCSARTCARVLGVEIDEERGAEAQEKITAAGPEVSQRCQLIIGNALDQDYSQGTAFFLYLIPRGLRIILPILQAIPHRIRVVTYMAPFPDEIRPVQCIKVRSVAHADAGVEWPLYVYDLNGAEGETPSGASSAVP